MTTIQHIIFALFAGIPIFWQMCFAVDSTLNWMNPEWFIIAFTVGTFLPDIEFMGSYIWEILKPWSVILQAEGTDDEKGPSFFHSLAAGEILHIGSNTSFGFGRYVLEKGNV